MAKPLKKIKRNLTKQQEAFAVEYLKDLNGTQAAKRAGYSKKTAHAQACRLLTDAKVGAEIRKRMREREEQTKIDINYVLTRLVEVDQMDVKDILNDDDSFLPINEWPKIWRQMISGLDVKEIFERDGKTLKKIGETKKIKWPDKIKNIELIGKHTSVGAWREYIQVGGDKENPLRGVLEIIDGKTKGLPSE